MNCPICKNEIEIIKEAQVKKTQKLTFYECERCSILVELNNYRYNKQISYYRSKGTPYTKEQRHELMNIEIEMKRSY